MAKASWQRLNDRMEEFEEIAEKRNILGGFRAAVRAAEEAIFFATTPEGKKIEELAIRVHVQSQVMYEALNSLNLKLVEKNN